MLRLSFLNNKKALLSLSLFFGAIVSGGLLSCTDSYTFSSYPCYLVIDNSVHQDATLASAMNAMSPGVFCMVTADEAGKKFRFKNNLGLESAKTFNAIDQRRTRALGMNNGLIIGYGSLDNVLFAYDRECPNCFDPSAVPVRTKPLSLGQDGYATCQVCHRRYNMNSGGFCESEGGLKPLTRYHVSTTGPFGVLSIGN